MLAVWTVVACLVSAEGDAAQTGSPFSTPMGFFHFGAYQKLNRARVDAVYVRTAIDWQEFEPQRGKLVFAAPNKQAKLIDQLLADGKKVVPSIRARSSWAVRPFPKGKCASAPSDLDQKKKLEPGASYSASYFDFVSAIAEKYNGKFEVVVIENEMNDPDFWCSSIDDYLRLFLTAKAAFDKIDPRVLVADGGLQGAALNWLVIEDLLDRKQTSQAIEYYAQFSGEKIDADALRKETSHKSSREPIRRADEIYNGPLFDWVDVVNFHYYQRADAISDVVAFLKKRAPAKPLMTNEVGIKGKFAGGVDGAAADMVKKYARLIALDVAPIIWFTPRGKQEHNAGAFIDEKGGVVPQTSRAFESISQFIGTQKRSYENVSTSTLNKFRFHESDRWVDVVWPKADVPNTMIAIEENCVAFGHESDEAIRGRSIAPTQAPLFVKCTRKPGKPAPRP